jgi:hypothetical protein
VLDRSDVTDRDDFTDCDDVTDRNDVIDSEKAQFKEADSRNQTNVYAGKQTSVSNLYPHASHSHKCRTRRASRYSDHSGRKMVSRHWAHSLTGRDRRLLRELAVFSSMGWPPAKDFLFSQSPWRPP